MTDNESVDMLIGNNNAFFMTVLEECVGMFRSNPQTTLTPLGRRACDGASPQKKKPVKDSRVEACVDLDIETRDVEAVIF